jgi:hypothetical protein
MDTFFPRRIYGANLPACEIFRKEKKRLLAVGHWAPVKGMLKQIFRIRDSNLGSRGIILRYAPGYHAAIANSQ